ncbi:MAG: hypothetical protein BAJALOKI1v1_1310010 [Promethearchaeota archaeon]|nr:MAG: hypothetical protein BAJALOKI1v1_1310010 [Candidatus Lokiarchaeota archaeon]
MTLIFAHRGASGYCPENTIQSFKTALDMSAEIESDIRLTKDKELICFHDPYIICDNKHYIISELTLSQIKKINFEDKREVPTLKEVFECFNKVKDLKYSFDIGSKEAAIGIIELAEHYSIVKNIFITDTHLPILKALRNCDPTLKLVHTIPHGISKLNQNNVPSQKLKEWKINTINIKANKYYKENFAIAIKNEFKCFFWGVNTRIRMKNLLRLKIDNHKVDAIYTDYPNKLIEVQEKYELI